MRDAAEACFDEGQYISLNRLHPPRFGRALRAKRRIPDKI